MELATIPDRTELAATAPTRMHFLALGGSLTEEGMHIGLCFLAK